jgi:hypothetical protein
MQKYAKFIVIVVATILSALSAALVGDNAVIPEEWVNVAILGVGAAGVFAAPNVLAVLAAGLTVLATVILGGITTAEIIQIVVAGLGALGVYSVPNKPGPV